MVILINTASTLKGGGLQVAISFLEDCKELTDNVYHVVLGAKLSTIIKIDEYPGNFFFYKISYRPATRIFSLKSHDRFLKNLEKKIKPDVVFTTTGPAYWRPLAPHVVGYNLPHHIYPESPYFDRLSLYRKLRWRVKRILVRYFFRRDADIIVVQTNDVRERLMRLLDKENIMVISNTFSPFYGNPASFLPRLPSRQKEEFRLLMLSAWYPHKNFGIIPQIIDRFSEEEKNRVRFILTLPEAIFEKEIAQKYKQNVINVGPVSVEEGPSLYKECDVMFLPTLLECFSASYSEAMVMEKPILTTDMGFSKSVCEDAAIYFNPVNPGDIAEKIRDIINNDCLKNELIAKGKKRMQYFGTSTQRTEEYLSICRKAIYEREN